MRKGRIRKKIKSKSRRRIKMRNPGASQPIFLAAAGD
jgi:hypothetical protein